MTVLKRRCARWKGRALPATAAAMAVACALSSCGGDSDSSSGAANAQAIAYQIDVAHSGVVPMAEMRFPTRADWQVSLPDAVSYPLIADGRVFVLTVGQSTGSYRVSAYALDRNDGRVIWGPIVIPTQTPIATHAYAAGRLFVVSFEGVLRSFDAATGAVGWSVTLPGQYAFDAPPTASQGKVFVAGAGSGGTVYAVDQASGALLWTRNIQGGSENSPTIGPHGVIVSYLCQTYSLAPGDGAPVWQIDLGCFGAGGPAAPYANGKVFVREYDFSASRYALSARDESTGALVTTRLLDSPPMLAIPAVTADAVYLQNAGTLRRLDPMLTTVAWSFYGDGTLASNPLVVGTHVLVGGTSGMLYAVDARTGAMEWSVLLPDSINASAQPPLTGFAAAEGYLVVPTGRVVTAWRIAP